MGRHLCKERWAGLKLQLGKSTNGKSSAGGCEQHRDE